MYVLGSFAWIPKFNRQTKNQYGKGIYNVSLEATLNILSQVPWRTVNLCCWSAADSVSQHYPR